jgi:hypothetical protein
VTDWCFMCKMSGESINYILFHCVVAKDLWTSIFSLFGIEWVMPQRLVELMDCWRGQAVNHCILEFWRMIILCFMWCI